MVAPRTLLLAAHGSSRSNADNPILRHAERIRAKGLFADVCCGFLKEAPLLTDVLGRIKTPELVIVPMFAGRGYITDDLIPQALAALPDTTTAKLCKPLGCHPAIVDVMAGRARAVITAENLPPQSVTVLLAGHGNEKVPEIARQTRALAGKIEKQLAGATVTTAFIEEPPLISHWPEITRTQNLIVMPFLIGGGMHEAEDVPAMLGITATNPALDLFVAANPHAGPFEAHQRTLWYCRPLGHEPALSDIILDLARSR